jgi:hypothetical protein
MMAKHAQAAAVWIALFISGFSGFWFGAMESCFVKEMNGFFSRTETKAQSSLFSNPIPSGNPFIVDPVKPLRITPFSSH